MTKKAREIKACLFDMDGTLINTEDIYTEAATELLALYGKGPLTWDIKIDLQGRPGPDAAQKVVDFYDLPITNEELMKKLFEIQKDKWDRSAFLPGALELLEYLIKHDIPIGLATSSNTLSYHKKTDHLAQGFSLFDGHIVTGDDPRIPPGCGKPKPDIWHACLKSINDSREKKGLEAIKMEECLIFEDGIPGVFSGKNTDGYVIWIPHPGALKQLNGKETEIIGEHDEGEILESLEEFDKAKFGLDR